MIRAAVDGVSARHAVTRAFEAPQLQAFFSSRLHVIAVGKAASAMATAAATHPRIHPQSILAIGTHRVHDMPAGVEWHEASHPVPDARSADAATRALTVASTVGRDAGLLLLLSGGASALMASPIDGITLDAKRDIVRRMMLGGADIHALNTVRKHLSRVKGGRLAAACEGTTLTLAVSDVVGDDLSVIGSGPGVPDPSTVDDARRALQEFAPGVRLPELPETPKPDDPRLARCRAFVIASRQHALNAARDAAEGLGYRVIVLEGDITGEARAAARHWMTRVRAVTRRCDVATCVLSAGETTVRVVGRGRGGRNQEFALALVDALASSPCPELAASVGTDGIDGPTDAAGALVDSTSLARASSFELDPRAFLADNNAYEFFANLGDLIHLGRTDTNVGDIQVLLSVPGARLQ